MMSLALLSCLWWASSVLPSSADTPPHIVIIMADDLGYNDVSFHGSDQFQTPNIDALAYSGVILHDYYTQPICTPSRAALLTGRHPIRNGMEHDVIYAAQPWGLPLSEKILPQYLQPLGYVSRAIGKWHLGFFHSNYTPAERGFDSHYGIWLGHQNHITHMGGGSHQGYDFHRELDTEWDARGQYSGDLFTEEAEVIIRDHNASRPLFLYLAHTTPHAPLQAPAAAVDKFHYIPTKKRRTFAAMVTALDETVGRVMAALKEQEMLDNSIILFITDNGGATHGYDGNVASNWPLRGGKNTLWEGGVRGVGLIWSPLLRGPPRVHRGLVNVADWLPTLLEAAGAPEVPGNLDGVSQWSALQLKAKPPRTTMLHNIDPLNNIAALRHGDWKVVVGRTFGGQYDGHYGYLNGKVPYNLRKIRRSEAAKAVEDTVLPLPTNQDMLRLRAEATMSCDPEKRGPHVIQVRETTFSIDANETDSLTSLASGPKECSPHIHPCLFNVRRDPCENTNLASDHPGKLVELLYILKTYHPVKPNNKPEDPRSNPENWNGTWVPWMDYV